MRSLHVSALRWSLPSPTCATPPPSMHTRKWVPCRSHAPLAHARVRRRHANGVVHCDLKPSNVLVVESADCELGKLTLKVADFGLSQMLELVRAHIPCVRV